MREQQKIQVDRDKVRMMVADLGYAETAQRLNILPATLRQWAKRFKWSVTPTHAQAVTSVTRPIAEVHAEVLQEYEGKTRLSLAKTAANMAKDCEELPARHAKIAHTVAQTMAIVHRQDQDKGNVHFSLNMLNLSLFEKPE